MRSCQHLAYMAANAAAHTTPLTDAPHTPCHPVPLAQHPPGTQTLQVLHRPPGGAGAAATSARSWPSARIHRLPAAAAIPSLARGRLQKQSASSELPCEQQSACGGNPAIDRAHSPHRTKQQGSVGVKHAHELKRPVIVPQDVGRDGREADEAANCCNALLAAWLGQSDVHVSPVRKRSQHCKRTRP